MTKFRDLKPPGGDREPPSDSDQSEKGDCVPQGVRRIMEKYNTPRKGVSNTPSGIRGTATPLSAFRSKFLAARDRMTPGKNLTQTPGSLQNHTAPLRSLNDNANRPDGNGNHLKRSSDAVEIFSRVRPLTSSNDEGCVRILNGNTLVVFPPENYTGWKAGSAKEVTYTFQRVFDKIDDQKSVFDNIALPLVKDFLMGKNSLLFAYGVTGSGKTYTMSGGSMDNGIMPRCLDIIFNSIAELKAPKFVFKPDRMNGFEVQSKSDASLERQREMSEKQRERDTLPKTPGRSLRAVVHTRSRFMTQTDQRIANGSSPVPFFCDPSWRNGGANMEAEYAQRIRDPTVVPINGEDCAYSVFVTYIEIYNNFVYDLLDESPIDMKVKAGLQSKMLREDANHNVYVNCVTEVEVESPEEAFEVYARGQRRRRMAHTALNTESSRSHSIFNIRLAQAPLNSEGDEVSDDKNRINISQLSLVDLAGSERYTRTGATGDRLKEAGNINNSLMVLRKCMEILRNNQQRSETAMVPYRDTKLTHFLKNYFEGEGRVRMVLCVNPRSEDYDENLHVMQFAEITSEVHIPRPQERKPDPGTPGRRKAHEMYKGVKQQLIDENIIQEDDLPSSDVQMVFNIGGPLPFCNMTKSSEAELLINLRKAMELRVKARTGLSELFHEKRLNLRLMLVNMEKEVQRLRKDNQALQYRYNQTSTDKTALEDAFKSAQAEKAAVEYKYDELEKEYTLLKEDLSNRDMEIRQREIAHFKDRERLKTDLDLQRELDELNRERQMQREEAKLKAEYRTKDKTIAKVRQIVSQVDLPRRSHRRRTGRGDSPSDSLSTSSDSEITSIRRSSPSPVRMNRSRVQSTPHLDNGDGDNSGNNLRGQPVLRLEDMRRQRRKSGDQWLEHRTGLVGAVPDTLFQPQMKKKKSVSHLKNVEDVAGGATKYCLTTQEQDSVGHVVTSSYKAAIHRTVGGGAQVVYEGKEVLKDMSPAIPSGSRKRVSSPVRNLHPEDREVIADRCKVGVMCQSPGKKTKKSRQE